MKLSSTQKIAVRIPRFPPPSISISFTVLANKQNLRSRIVSKMRLVARENADQGILLAATTEHFRYYPASQVRLS